MNRSLKTFCQIAAILAVSSVLAGISQADQSTYRSSIQLPAVERTDREEEAALRRAATISENQALTAAQKAVPGGKLLEKELDLENGNVVYEFEFLVNNEERVVIVDAGNGSILANYLDRD